VFDPGELIGKTMEVATLLASKSPIALGAAKQECNRALSGEHAANLDGEATHFAELFASADAKEGMTAFVEKRDPVFRGR
jgi:enoyl-CoA hydratase